MFLSQPFRIKPNSTRRGASFFGFRNSAQWGEIVINKLILTARHLNKEMFCRKIENEK